jgi:hypothetical protein
MYEETKTHQGNALNYKGSAPTLASGSSLVLLISSGFVLRIGSRLLEVELFHGQCPLCIVNNEFFLEYSLHFRIRKDKQTNKQRKLIACPYTDNCVF